METEIAKTRRSMMAAYIVILVFGALIMICGLAMLIFSPDRFVAVVFLPIGALLLGMGIGFTVYFARLPKVCITMKDGKLRLHNGLEFSPSEIDYCTSSTWGLDGLMYNYGTLIVSVRHQEYKFRFVIDVNAVVTKLNALKAQSTAIEEVQKQIAERKAAEKAAEIPQNEENQG